MTWHLTFLLARGPAFYRRKAHPLFLSSFPRLGDSTRLNSASNPVLGEDLRLTHGMMPPLPAPKQQYVLIRGNRH